MKNHRTWLGGALALLIVSVAVCGVLSWRAERTVHGAAGEIALSGAPYEPAVADTVASHVGTWNPPPPQSRGREWVYDTFTPPEIFYHARAKQFTVRPPAGLGDETTEAFGVELVSVRPEPFRLQLIGYVGDEGKWRGTFENVATGEVFLGGAGRRVPELGLVIESLDVKPQPVALAESMTTWQRVATARVRDERAGREVLLTHRERQVTDSRFAVLAVAGETAAREVRAGDSFKVGPVTYRVDRIQLSPVAVEMTRESPDLAQPDRRTLTPRPLEVTDEKPGGS